MDTRLSGCAKAPGTASFSSPRLSVLRRGVTLPELLVTVSAVGVTLSLLIPALSVARESARRVACLNNLAQMGKAVAAYDSSQGYLPGWRNALRGYSEASGKAISWSVAILPFLGEREIYSWYETYASTGAARDDVRQKRLPRYVCPTVLSVAKTPAPLSYMANGGTGAESIRADGQQYRGDAALVDAVGANNYYAGRNSLTLVADGDGSSSTLLITERAGFEAPLEISWADSPLAAPLNANAVATTHLVLHPPALASGATPPTGLRVINPTASTTISQQPDWQLRYPSSRHGEGVCAVFCDGRAQFVSEKIAPWVYGQILTSDARAASPRAAAWEMYPANGQWVRYVFDEKDLAQAK